MASTASSLLVECLVAQGCDRVFTVPGESFLPVLDALRDRANLPHGSAFLEKPFAPAALLVALRALLDEAE